MANSIESTAMVIAQAIPATGSAAYEHDGRVETSSAKGGGILGSSVGSARDFSTAMASEP